MNITFNNKNSASDVLLEYENCTYKIPPEQSLDLPTFRNDVSFSVTMEPLSADSLSDDSSTTSLKGRIINKIVGKLVDTMSMVTLNPRVTYQFVCDNNSAVIDLTPEEWGEFDGDVALFIFDTYPIMRSFCRAESENVTLRVKETQNTNLKKFLKVTKLCLLFFQWTSFLLGLLLFVPYYTVIRYFVSDFHFSKVLKRLYNMSAEQRQTALEKNTEKLDIFSSKGCAKFLVISVLAVVALVVIAELIQKFMA